MKLPVTETLKTIAGEDVKTPPSENEPSVPITFAVAVQNALLGHLRGDESMDGATKLQLHGIATKTLDLDADYTIGEAQIIKERVGRLFSPLVVGPVWNMIEAAGQAEAKT